MSKQLHKNFIDEQVKLLLKCYLKYELIYTPQNYNKFHK